jgi:hypothetical protein
MVSTQAGSWLTNFLFPRPAERRVSAIFRWWESRRLPYNLIVGVSGGITIVTLTVLSALPPSPFPFAVPLGAIVVYGAFANVCYTLGSLLEIAFHKLWGSQVLPVGPTLFRAGLTLSVGLTLVVPVIFAVVVWVLRVIEVLI